MFTLIRHAGYQPMSGSLTSEGVQVTKELAERLQATGITWKQICASPTRRTVETAMVISEALSLPVGTDKRLGMEGNFVDLLPPEAPSETIFISHLPVLTKILRIWSRSLKQEEPPLTEMGHGYLIDPERKTITRI